MLQFFYHNFDPHIFPRESIAFRLHGTLSVSPKLQLSYHLSGRGDSLSAQRTFSIHSILVLPVFLTYHIHAMFWTPTIQALGAKFMTTWQCHWIVSASKQMPQTKSSIFSWEIDVSVVCAALLLYQTEKVRDWVWCVSTTQIFGSITIKHKKWLSACK